MNRFNDLVVLSMLAVSLSAPLAQGANVPPPNLRMALNQAMGAGQPAYHFSAAGPGRYVARHDGLGVDVEVGPEGLTVQSGAGRWTLRAGEASLAGQPHQTAPNQVEMDFGWAREWIINGPEGVEQGWEIAERPSWAVGDAPLRIPLEQQGNLRAGSPDADGRALWVKDEQGRIAWRYAGLRVTDADGNERPARFVAGDRNASLWLEVVDQGARYPLTIDPWVERAKLVATDSQSSDNLGYSVALSADGSLCAAGAYKASPGGTNGAGAVYIFTNANGGWISSTTQCAKLIASDLEPGSYLGASVALSGNGRVCAAAAFRTSVGGVFSAGAVYIFTNNNGRWSGVMNESAKLFASDRVEDGDLGSSVALSEDGSVCAVGAIEATPGGVTNAGVVYIFTNNNGRWSGVSNECARLFATDRQHGDYLGRSVALSANGGVCAAGAIRASCAGLTNWAGAAYIFTNVNGSWAGVSNECAKLVASDWTISASMGSAVALSADGGVCAVGAKHAGVSNPPGAVYIFTNVNGRWAGVSNECARLSATDGEWDDVLGSSVALSADGGGCAAGAYKAGPGGVINAGAVYLFAQANGRWAGVSNEYAKLAASDRQTGDYLGYAVALSADGRVCAAGASQSDPGGVADAGAVYAFHLSIGASLGVAPSSLVYSASYNGSNPVSQIFVITNGGAASCAWTNEAAYSAGASGWFAPSAWNGALAAGAAAAVTGAVSVSGLNAGVYTATNTISAATATNEPQQMVVTLTVGRGGQTIAFPAIATQTERSVVGLAATADSGLAVSFQVASGPGQITGPGGTNLSFTGAGWVSVRALQGGNANWLPAAPVTNTFRVLGWFTLTIESPYGTAVPLAGVYTNLEDTLLTNAIMTPDTRGATQYVCAGWAMTGHDPAAGTATQLVMTATNHAVLTWLWTTNYYLAASAGPHGTIDRFSGWLTNGEMAVLNATPDSYYHFAAWTGSVATADNPLNLVMDAAKWVTATFAETWTTNKPTPEWWLARYGITNRFEEAVTNDADGDGIPTGDEWVMNTDPTNGLSYLRVIHIGLEGNLGTLAWPCATDRVYDVQYDLSGPEAGWAPVEGLTNLAPNSEQLVITNALDANALKFYRLKARLP